MQAIIYLIQLEGRRVFNGVYLQVLSKMCAKI